MTSVSILVVSLGYLLGAIPFGLLLTKFAGMGDVRKIGSGNIGATNVLRTGHKALAAATLALDTGKGAAAVVIANHFAPEVAALAGFAAFMGHCFPLWLKFKGGKGVATFVGVLLALSWQAGLLAILTWAVVAVAFRMASLASLIAAVLAPVYLLLVSTRLAAMWVFVMTVVILVRHTENIKRLMRGEEPKIGQGGKK